MRLTAEQLNRATLDRQGLLSRQPLDVVAGVRRAVALQGQEPAAPYVALWARLEGFDPAALDAAFVEGLVVKASLMRITLHVVDAREHAWFHAAMAPLLRASRVNDRRFRDAGLRPEQADALVAPLLAAASSAVTSADVTRRLADHLGEQPHDRLWWALRTYAPLVRAPTGDPWTFGPTTAYLGPPTPPSPSPGRDEAVRHLVRRYLEGFGPASVADVAQFSLLRRTTVRQAIATLADELVRHEGPGGEQLHDVVGATVPNGGTAAPPRLLGMWDSTLLAYADRSRILPEALRGTVIRRNGDTLPTVLVDGRVRGVWRHTDEGVEVTPLGPIDEAAWAALDEEASSLHAMLDARDPSPFSRYHRWWDRLPIAGRRVLGT